MSSRSPSNQRISHRTGFCRTRSPTHRRRLQESGSKERSSRGRDQKSPVFRGESSSHYSHRSRSPVRRNSKRRSLSPPKQRTGSPSRSQQQHDRDRRPRQGSSTRKRTRSKSPPLLLSSSSRRTVMERPNSRPLSTHEPASSSSDHINKERFEPKPENFKEGEPNQAVFRGSEGCKFDPVELKSIRIDVKGRPSSISSAGRLFDPQTFILHRRPGEGSHPIFDREDIVKNVEKIESSECKTQKINVQNEDNSGSSRPESRDRYSGSSHPSSRREYRHSSRERERRDLSLPESRDKYRDERYDRSSSDLRSKINDRRVERDRLSRSSRERERRSRSLSPFSKWKPSRERSERPRYERRSLTPELPRSPSRSRPDVYQGHPQFVGVPMSRVGPILAPGPAILIPGPPRHPPPIRLIRPPPMIRVPGMPYMRPMRPPPMMRGRGMFIPRYYHAYD